MSIQESQGYSTNNQSYMNDSFFRLRLDTTELLGQLEAYYRGSRLVGWEEKNGVMKPKFEKFGRPRMNEAGIQDMMSWLTSLLNPQTVQGNTEEEFFSNFIADLRINLSVNVMNNMHDYEISINDFEGIIDKTIAISDMFFSRTVNNLERESYGETFKTVERIGEAKSNSWLPFKN